MAQTTTSAESPPYTNLYTPENAEFFAKFEYKSLHKDYEEIRLLEIDPSNSERRGMYKMSQPVPLGVAGTYCAISYYSGLPTKTRPVWIDGVKMNIFANLDDGIAAAIRCWKNTTGELKRPLRLWVDQICINQSDAVEKSHQANFMREIYQRATYVYVSMRTESDVQPALDWLNELYNQEQPHGYKAEPGMLYSNIPPVRRRERDPEYPALFWWHLYQIIGHQWWSRSWVYQEFIVGSQVIFLFSEEYWTSWGKLHCLLSFFLQQDTVQACEEIIALRRRADDISQRCGPFMDKELVMNSVHKARGVLCGFLGWDEYTVSFRDPRYWPWNKCGQSEDGSCCLGVCCLPLTIIVSGACFLTAAARSIPYVLGYGYFHLPACPGYELLRTKKSWDRISSEGLEMPLEYLPIWNRDQALVTRVIQGKQRWQDSGSQYQLDLSYLLNHARNTKSSQPKDRIYAFVGLSTLQNNIQINHEPTYSINALLADVARAIVLCEDVGLDILSQAGTAAHSRALPQGSDRLPTWIPDWNEQEVFDRDKFSNGLELPPNSAAGKHLEKSVSFSADRFGNHGRVLEAAGTRIGRLGMVVDPAKDDFGSWRSFSGVETGSRITTTNVAQPEDEVWVLHGMSWPVVLRRSSVADNTTFLAVAMMWEGERPHQIMSGSGVVGEVGRVVVT